MNGRVWSSGAAPLAWVVLVARVVATTLLTITLGLVAWSVLPRAAGWSPSVVMTGSMEPRLHPGDVVLSAPADAQTVRPGQIILVTNPAQPSHLLVHRFVRWNAAGQIITKGDANRAEDSTPVPPASVHGLPRLRLPYVGLGVVWLRNHDWQHLGLAVLVLLAAWGLLVSGPTLPEAADDEPAGAPVDLRRDQEPEPTGQAGLEQRERLDRLGRPLPARDPATGRFISSSASR
jgi:signal peptidase